MRIFIVHAHHDSGSFNAALTREATEGLRAAGHDVVVSDLHAMGFDPVSDRRNFTTVKDPQRLKQQAEEEHASAHDGYVPELQAEMDKLAWCDTLILQFPLWWMGMPAILKGWIDRVFAVGRVYGGGRYFSRGVLSGKRALCSVTTGGPAQAYSDIGLYAPIEQILATIHHGVLGFVGFSVLEPFVAYAPSKSGEEARAQLLREYRERLLRLDGEEPLPRLDLSRYDGLVRKPAYRVD